MKEKNLYPIIYQLFEGKTDDALVQLFRYVFVGGAAFAVDFGLLWALKEFAHLHYLIAATLSFAAGLTTNYLLSTRWVFNRAKMKSKTAEFAIFTLIGIVGLLLNDLIMWFFTEKLALYYLLSKIVATLIVFFWNFLSRKFILFTSGTDCKSAPAKTD
jgi:putative flippase GtrA